MRVAIYHSDKIFHRWPESYVGELAQKLLDRGHRVFIVKDDSPKETNEKVISECDCFVGAPGEYYAIAKEKGLRVIGLLGATKKGEGVVSSIACAGCMDVMDNLMDCMWHDDLCMAEITPNDVLGVLCE